MLTDSISCYKLNKTSTPIPSREQFSRTERLSNFLCNQSFVVLKHWCLLISKRKKSYIFKFFTHAFRKQLALIILGQRLHSINTYVACSTSLRGPDFSKWIKYTLTKFLLRNHWTNFNQRWHIEYMGERVSSLLKKLGISPFLRLDKKNNSEKFLEQLD